MLLVYTGVGFAILLIGYAWGYWDCAKYVKKKLEGKQ